MPIYEYRCSSCGHKLETLQRLADAPLVVCPSCGQSKLVKLVTAAGFQLKGSGWYATDFRGSGSKPAEKPGDGESKATESKAGPADSKTESKPEAKAASAASPSTSATPAGSGPAAS